MNWEFANYPSVWRARALAREAGLSGEPATHVLYGLLRLAEERGLACELSSEQALESVRARPARNFEDLRLPQVGYSEAQFRSGREWLRLFERGELGWQLCLEVGVDPLDVLRLAQADRSPLSLLGFHFSPRFWTSDWEVLQQLLEHGPLHNIFGARVGRAIDWLERNRPQSDRQASRPANPAPEPPLVDLIAILARLSTVVQIFWMHGLAAPVYREDSVGRLSVHGRMSPQPGREAAAAAGHWEIHPIHQFLSGLRDPRYQLDFAPVRRAVEAFLSEIPPHTRAGLRFTPGAQAVLSKLADFCCVLNVDASPLHVSWAAFRSPDALLEKALEAVDRARLETDLEREIFGILPDAHLSVEGVHLGQPADQLGPLRQVGPHEWLTQAGAQICLSEAGRVREIQGRRLSCAGQTLLDRDSRPSEFERLLGLGRTNRWTPVYGGAMLKVEIDQGTLESVALAL